MISLFYGKHKSALLVMGFGVWSLESGVLQETLKYLSVSNILDLMYIVNFVRTDLLGSVIGGKIKTVLEILRQFT